MKKCINCNSTEIETDISRGDEICTNCGSVLSDNLIISEVQFEEVGHGAKAAMGQFVSTESKGGASGYGKFHYGNSTESREITLKKAKTGISHLCNMLQLNSHCMDTAHNFFKMALTRNLTRGRKNALIYAACVYITCRTEGTSHLLIDISDALQICCYELGRTYLKLSQALCINIPSIDPCIYIMRFANRLEFGDKTHEVSMTAQRLVKRMKKDSIHSGRRPSGLCGAALLIAARMHDYSRKPDDIVRVVKIHESTLRKRLLEFGETPSSALTIEEFMNIDLEAEQDPPAFKAARKRDKERLARLTDECELTTLQIEIDAAIERDLSNSRKRKLNIAGCSTSSLDVYDEQSETSKFIEESTLDVINECLKQKKEREDHDDESSEKVIEDTPPLLSSSSSSGLKPDLIAICTVSEKEQNQLSAPKAISDAFNDLELDGLDDDEINGYILSENEAIIKDRLWKQMNAEYLQQAKEREERAAKEREDGKPERKKRRGKKKPIGPSSSAGEAIEKMLQEKKISTKINYDILKSLTTPSGKEEEPETSAIIIETKTESTAPNVVVKVEPSPRKSYINLSKNRRSKTQMVGLPVGSNVVSEEKPLVNTAEKEDTEAPDEDEEEDMMETEEQRRDDRLGDILNQDDDEESGYLGAEDYY